MSRSVTAVLLGAVCTIAARLVLGPISSLEGAAAVLGLGVLASSVVILSTQDSRNRGVRR